MARSSASQEVLALYEVSKILTASLEAKKAIRQSLSVLSSFLGMHRGMVVVRHESEEEDGLQVMAAPELSLEEAERTKETRKSIVRQVMKTGMPQVAEEEGGTRVSLLAVPIAVDGQVLGALGVERPEKEKPGGVADDLKVLTMVARLMGQALRLASTVEAERRALLQEKENLKAELSRKYSIANVIGRSKRMQEVFAQVYRAAEGKATVLLRGESGTGKEALARAIHYLSPRKSGPFVKLNCAALPETLLESELFGHEKGAFTGALAERKGRFELAHGGTLFLDEIGDISPAFQAKLLRVLQEREFERVGGQKTIKVDVRLVAATNRNLEEAVAKGEFRADLYYRINVVSIFLPPLRERKEDIPLLTEHFLKKFNEENQKNIVMTPEALGIMLRCYWPGNVRELENCIERTATMVHGSHIRSGDLLCSKHQCFSTELWEKGRQKEEGEEPEAEAGLEETFSHETPEDGRNRVLWALERSGWVQAKAARLLGVTPRQLGYAIRKHRIPLRKL